MQNILNVKVSSIFHSGFSINGVDFLFSLGRIRGIIKIACAVCHFKETIKIMR